MRFLSYKKHRYNSRNRFTGRKSRRVRRHR